MRRWIPAMVSFLWAVGLLMGQTPTEHRALKSVGEMLIDGQSMRYIPRWNSSRLVGCDPCQSGSPVLWTVDRQGHREEIPLDIPGSGFVSVWSVASGPDGTLAVVGDALSNDSRLAEFVAAISPDRQRQILKRVWPFHPYTVTMAPDGTIWAVGPVLRENGGTYNFYLHENVLRHYDTSGNLLQTVTVNGLRKYNGIGHVSGGSALMASSDRIGWLTHACEYIEFSFTGIEMGRYTCPNGATDSFRMGGVGLSSSNELLVTGRTTDGPFTPLELDRATGQWSPVAVTGQPRNGYGLVGFDGTTLVTYPNPSTLRRFNWSGAAPAAQ